MKKHTFLLGALGWLMFVTTSWLTAAEKVPDSIQQRRDGTVVFRVTGDFRNTENKARDEALIAAQQQMREWLKDQDPSIERVPSLDVIRREMIPAQRQPPVVLDRLQTGETMYKVTVEVEMKPQHIRSLRARDRVLDGLAAVGCMAIIFAGIAGLFRIDEWTKGYLTKWLIFFGCCLSASMGMLWLIARVW